jgi:hypothetical protein
MYVATDLAEWLDHQKKEQARSAASHPQTQGEQSDPFSMRPGLAGGPLDHQACRMMRIVSADIFDHSFCMSSASTVSIDAICKVTFLAISAKCRDMDAALTVAMTSAAVAPPAGRRGGRCRARPSPHTAGRFLNAVSEVKVRR